MLFQSPHNALQLELRRYGQGENKISTQQMLRGLGDNGSTDNLVNPKRADTS